MERKARYKQCRLLVRYYRRRVRESISNVRAYAGDDWRVSVHCGWLRSHLAAYRYWQRALRTT